MTNSLAWVAVGAFVAAIVARLGEPGRSDIPWNRASTWFSLAKEAAMWAIVIRVLA